MHNRIFRIAFPLTLLGAVAACDDETTGETSPPFDDCDGESIRAALSSAASGDTVTIGACTVEGTFEVPAGVTLKGQGKGETTITTPANGIGVTLMPGASAAALQDLTVESDGAAAIVARGEGDVSVTGVEVHATLGIGIGAEDVSSLSLSDVLLTGPVTSDNVDELAGDATTLDTATHGLVIVRVGAAALSNVDVSGFADFGALFIESVVTWNGGSASDNRGTGAMFEGGEVTMASLEFCRNLRGQRQLPPYGAIVSSIVEGVSSPTGTATDVNFCDNEGVGLLLKKASSFELRGLSGAPATITGNVAAGLLALDSENLVLTHVEITGTTAGELPFGENDAILPLGDGVQLVRTSQGVEFTSVSMTDNERTGMILDIGPDVDVGPDPMDPTVMYLMATWTNVYVEAVPPDGFGAMCQGDFDDPGGQKKSWGLNDEDDWDLGIQRNALALTQDDIPDENTFSLSIVEAGDPCNMPAPTEIAGGGLMAVGVP